MTPEDLYPDAREGIHYLNSKGISCHILTNGGHPLKYLGRARHPLKEIDLFLTPGELGINKPHCMAFIPFVGLLKTFPRRILFVGDCYDRDVCGAKNVGFSTVWLKRVSDSDVADEVSAVNDGGCADFIVNDIGKDSFEKILNSLK